MNSIRHVRVAGLIFVMTLSTSPARAENWPGWRGADRNGVSGETDLPVRWSANEGIAWKTPLPGSGISSPVVWEDRVFLTSSDGPQQNTLHVICLDRDTGKELWRRRFWGTAPTLHHDFKSSMASPTPVTDGKFLYCFFGTGDVFCLETDGRLVWQRSLAAEYGEFENRFAASSSPLLYRDLLLLQCDHYGASYVIGLNVQTGDNRWKTDRPECWLSWASPQLVPAGESDRHELIVCGSHKIDAFDPLSGTKLWTVGGLRRECIPTPVFGHGLLFAVSGPKGPTLAIRPGGRGDVSETHVAWQNARGGPFVPSAIQVGDLYYLIDDYGIGTCLDAKTGQTVWQKRLPGAYTASPVAAGGRVYFMNESGTTIVLDASVREYRELARNELGTEEAPEPVLATPAVSQGRLFIRAAGRLWCVR